MNEKYRDEHQGWSNEQTFLFNIWLGMECFAGDIKWILENTEEENQLRTMVYTLQQAFYGLLERMEVVTDNPDQDFIYSQVAVSGRYINFKELAEHYLDSYIEQNTTCNVV